MILILATLKRAALSWGIKKMTYSEAKKYVQTHIFDDDDNEEPWDEETQKNWEEKMNS